MLQAEKPILRMEGGVTEISLANARLLIAEHGRPNLVKLWSSEWQRYVVTVEWPDDYKHSFTGFAWGYGGTGPHGLADFAEMIGLGRLLSLRMIIGGLLEKQSYIFRFAPRTFGGEPEWTR